jgi:hypothetical protein
MFSKKLHFIYILVPEFGGERNSSRNIEKVSSRYFGASLLPKKIGDG